MSGDISERRRRSEVCAACDAGMMYRCTEEVLNQIQIQRFTYLTLHCSSSPAMKEG